MVTFDDLCNGEPLIDYNLLQNDTYPHFTQCFQDTVLTWCPCAFIWLSCPFYMIYLYKLRKRPIPVSRLYIVKTLISILLVLVAALDILRSSTHNSNTLTDARLMSDILLIVSFILTIYLTRCERLKGIITSWSGFIFWLILAVTNIIPCYILIIQKIYNMDVLKFFLFIVHWMLVLVQFVLHCFADNQIRYFNTTTDREPNPEVFSSVLSRLTFWWFNRIVTRGKKKPLEDCDVWDLHPTDKHGRVVSKFERFWQQELHKHGNHRVSVPTVKFHSSNHEETETTPLIKHIGKQTSKHGADDKSKVSLFRVMAKIYGPELVLSWFCKFIYDVAQFIPPLLLGVLIRYTDRKRDGLEFEWKGYVYALAFFVVALVMSVGFQQNFHIGMTAGMRMRSALLAAIYKKSLLIDNNTRSKNTLGEIVNLMSVDCQRMQDFAGYLWMLWTAPVEITLSIVLLWQQLGPSTLAGVAVMILLIPVNACIAIRQRRLQVQLIKHKDRRIKLMSEVLNGIKVLKLNAWEIAFQNKIKEIRDKELQELKSYAYLQSFSIFSYTCAPTLVTLATFVTYILSSDTNHLDPERAFVSLSLFNILKYPINLLPMIVSFAIQGNISIGRIGNFLLSSELQTNSYANSSQSDDAVSVENGQFKWERETPIVLNRINLHVPKGQLMAVVGQVGCGKSSLISAILGEMEKIKGKIQISGSKAYVSQQAWIQNATVRDNILFGSQLDQSLYDQVIEACALTADLTVLPGGDLTEIGEKGINLSGGQKQRISLARAVYNNADIYLLDDPLSAVDVHVGKHIFKKVIGSHGMLREKTRMLVTHGVHWLPMVDTIVVITDGIISEMGSYESLMSHDGPFAQFLKTHLTEQKNDSDTEEDAEIQKIRDDMLEKVESLTSSGGTTSGDDDRPIKRRKTRRKKNKEDTTQKQVEQKTVTQPVTIIQEETSQTGQVKLKVFMSYCRALGFLATLCIIVLYTCSQSASVASSIWLSVWTEDPLLRNTTLAETSKYKSTNYKYITVFAVLALSQALIVLGYSLVYNLRHVRATGRLHSTMLKSVIRGSMVFFDSTPAGRILNRFSRDVETIDANIPHSFSMWINIFFSSLSTIVVISYSTPLFLTTIIPIILCYYFIQRYYVPTSRQLQRLESTSRSPIYTHFSETVSGAATIRAFGHQDRFIKECLRRVDHNITFYAARIASNRWLGTRLELLGNFVVIAAAMFAVNSPDISGGTVGLSISYALQITLSLNMLVRESTDLETYAVSVERLEEYSHIEKEAALFKSKCPSPEWPQRGHISFRNFTTRYREGLDLVLKGISCDIQCGEKVGVVGRTGAGKSSLTLSLFRLIEPVDGAIYIDGIDISQIGLHELRSKLTVLPQDPILFSGTLRMNLDPFDEHSEQDIWKALEHAHLKSFVAHHSVGLLFECGEGGSNLSVGQRQLACLARTLLRKTKILILDEATAAVDMETDELIQQTIRSEFSGCTILTVAHRINTILDYDRVMVLDDGHVVEFDKPGVLLDDKKSSFYSMARDAKLT